MSDLHNAEGEGSVPQRRWLEEAKRGDDLAAELDSTYAHIRAVIENCKHVSVEAIRHQLVGLLPETQDMEPEASPSSVAIARRFHEERLGPGDTAYTMAWCAWREGAGFSPVADMSLEDRRRFLVWWENVGRPQLEQYGYRLLDTGSEERLSEEERKALKWAVSICREVQSSHSSALESARDKLERGASVSPSSPSEAMPVFVIKAKDNLARAAIEAYRQDCIRHGLTGQAREVQKAIDEVIQWRLAHPDECKFPDHEHVPAGLPGSGSTPSSPAPSADHPVPGGRWRIFWRGDGTLEADPVSPTWAGGGVIAMREEDLALEARARVAELEKDRDEWKALAEQADHDREIAVEDRHVPFNAAYTLLEGARARVAELEEVAREVTEHVRDEEWWESGAVCDNAFHRTRHPRQEDGERFCPDCRSSWWATDGSLPGDPSYAIEATLRRALLSDTEGGEGA